MPKINRPKIIVIVGPTASGKSDLAIHLARNFNGEIISADSRQVYRGLDIGAGKVSKKDQRLAKHWLIDVADPRRRFSVAQFKSRASRAIADIIRRGKLPIVCGGTGLYIDALVYDLNLPEVPPNRQLRTKLEKQSAEQLFARLQKLDTERAWTIDRHNKVRLIRALEIIAAAGKVPELNTDYSSHKPEYDILWLGLNPKNLDNLIATRLAKRFRQGLIAEIKKLRDSGVSFKRLYELGLEYRWVSEYLQNKISKQEMESGLLSAIRQYARRQMTWFKRNKNIRWNMSRQNINQAVDKFLKRDIFRPGPIK